MKKIVWVLVFILSGLLMGITVHVAQETELIASSYDINGYSVAYYENGKVVFHNYGDGIYENSVFELASNGKEKSLLYDIITVLKLCHLTVHHW